MFLSSSPFSGAVGKGISSPLRHKSGPRSPLAPIFRTAFTSCRCFWWSLPLSTICTGSSAVARWLVATVVTFDPVAVLIFVLAAPVFSPFFTNNSGSSTTVNREHASSPTTAGTHSSSPSSPPPTRASTVIPAQTSQAGGSSGVSLASSVLQTGPFLPSCRCMCVTAPCTSSTDFSPTVLHQCPSMLDVILNRRCFFPRAHRFKVV